MRYGDPVSNALETLVARSFVAVRTAALRHGLDSADLDELLQDVRFRIWRAHPDGATIATAQEAYVYRTAASAALDMLRARQRARRPSAGRAARLGKGGTSAFEALRDDLPGSENPAGILELRELERAVESAVERMRPARQSVVRAYLRGHSLAEIARLMEWPEARTRSALYRALDDLRAELARGGYGSQRALHKKRTKIARPVG